MSVGWLVGGMRTIGMHLSGMAYIHLIRFSQLRFQVLRSSASNVVYFFTCCKLGWISYLHASFVVRPGCTQG
jgi:hypothetical protein